MENYEFEKERGRNLAAELGKALMGDFFGASELHNQYESEPDTSPNTDVDLSLECDGAYLFLEKIKYEQLYRQGKITEEEYQRRLDEIESITSIELPNIDDWAGTLKLNSTLRTELALILKYADDEELLVCDLKDMKAVIEYILENINESKLRSYGFIKNNLIMILRQVNFAEANEAGISDVRGSILSIDGIMTGEDFESLCSEILRRKGYTDVVLTPGSGDHGVDILAEKDEITYAIQCKYYSKPVGNSAVQEVFSGKRLYHKDVAIVMTNSVFTSQAQKDADDLGVKLWDGAKIEQWIADLSE